MAILYVIIDAFIRLKNHILSTMDFTYKNREIKIKYALAVLIYRLPLAAYLALSVHLTGQIKTRKELVDYVISRPLADQSIPLEERLLRWNNFVKEQPLQVFDLVNYKGKNKERLRLMLNWICIEPPKKLGRPKTNIKDKLIGRPYRKYQPSCGKLHKNTEEFMAICLGILDSLSDIHKREVEKALYKDLASFF